MLTVTYEYYFQCQFEAVVDWLETANKDKYPYDMVLSAYFADNKDASVFCFTVLLQHRNVV